MYVYIYVYIYKYIYTYMYMYIYKYICMCVCMSVDMYWIAMGWLHVVGSLKLQVSFVEYSLFYRALLQKRPVFLHVL